MKDDEMDAMDRALSAFFHNEADIINKMVAEGRAPEVDTKEEQARRIIRAFHTGWMGHKKNVDAPYLMTGKKALTSSN